MADYQQCHISNRADKFSLKAANMHSLKTHRTQATYSWQRAKILTAMSASIFKPVSQKEKYIFLINNKSVNACM